MGAPNAEEEGCARRPESGGHPYDATLRFCPRWLSLKPTRAQSRVNPSTTSAHLRNLDFTLALGKEGRAAVERLFAMAHQHGLVATVPPIDPV